MQQLFQKATALILSAFFLASTAFASVPMGDELYQNTSPLGDGTSLTKQIFWSRPQSDLKQENYVTYKPGSTVKPTVSYGETVLTRQTVGTMAKTLEQSGRRVLSGINGDFFVLATGDPLGIVISDGILRSSASYLSAIGFLPDGSAIIGKPGLNVKANFHGNSLLVSEVNKIRTDSGYYLLDSDFSASTKNTKPGVDVVLRPLTDNLGQSVTTADGLTLTQSDVLKIGSRVSCVVESIHTSVPNLPIPQGQFVLTVNSSANAWLVSELSSLVPGETVEFDISCSDTRWNNVTQALGAMDRVLIDGAVPTGLNRAIAPRTAIGVKADGTVLFYTVDGRQKGLSIGASLTDVGTRLAELGCMNAVALDGGGSTSLGITALDQGVFSLINSPSDGNARAVTNALFLVSGTTPTGTPGSVYIAPPRSMLLNGSSFQFTASMVDSGYYPMAGTGTSFTWSALHGTITAAGQYTAPATGGYDEITATANGVSGIVGVQLVPTPDRLDVLDQATASPVTRLNLAADQIVDLTAAAVYRTLPLIAQDASFTWTLDPWLGAVTPEGIITAGKTSTSGMLTVSAGSCTVSIPVSVAAVPDTTPPTVTLTNETQTIHATVTDNTSSAFTAEQLTLTLDGTAVPFTWDGTTLTASLPTLSESLHRLTATAADISGNLGRASLTLNSDKTYPTPFMDMTGHWAESYTTCLNHLGIISGMDGKNGLIFEPNKSITRGDFALMTARFMHVNPDDFSAVTLPFSDVAKIPNWSLNAVKAMYDKGIMKGTQVGGTLCANATAAISRAEAMTILGRIQPSGYPKAPLSAYQDAADVPEFAKPHMQVLIGLQVVSGSDGLLRPSDPVSRSEVSKMLFTLL